MFLSRQRMVGCSPFDHIEVSVRNPILVVILVLLSWVGGPPRSAEQAPAKPAPAALTAEALGARVDEYMRAQVKANTFSGSILLARDGKPLLSKGYGFANLEWQVPATPQTKFRIGSVTKQFTSMLVMQLVQEGKLKTDDSICQHVAPCPDTWKPITIHHLLTHTSGIPSYTNQPDFRKTMMVPTSTDELISKFRDLPLEFPPGSQFKYNNSGYFLLGVIIEKLAGSKYEEVLRRRILTPLGMNDTGYDWPRTILPRRASGYAGRGRTLANAPAVDMQQPFSAGALYSTTEDLLKWDQALYGDTLLPEAARKTMFTPFKDNYAYGWGVRPPSPETFGRLHVSHGGGINGFSAMIVRLPEDRVTAIVLANNETAAAGPIARDLLSIYFGQPYKVPVERTAVKIDTKVYDAYVGRYALSPAFVITVTREGDRLFAQATNQPRLEIFPQSETAFFYEVVDAQITFERDASGKATALVLHQNNRDQRGPRIESR